MIKLNLNGEWKFKDCDSTEYLMATVPGCNYTDLMALKIIPDPFDSTNEKLVQWVAEKNWEYIKTFTVSEEMFNSEDVVLDCEMLDTICDVFVNEMLVGKGENAHINYVFDIKKAIKLGENVVKIVFNSPVAYIETLQKQDKMPKNNMGITGVPHIRKPQCHFGWDWGPILPFSGIVKNISVIARHSLFIKDVRLEQDHTATDKVNLSFCLEMSNKQECDIEIELISPQKIKTTFNKKIEGKLTSVLEIKKPELWWTQDLSDNKKQPLYTLKFKAIKDGVIISELHKKVGLRRIELNRSDDEYGKNFQFVVNGIPIFAKGGNWIPADSFYARLNKEKLHTLLDSCKTANFNMIRVWGGGYYESDEFYDYCDENGILVWQDFAFACAPYPFYRQEFLDNVKKEIECNVKRLRHHASLALWCGNNEIEMMTIGWKTKVELVKWTEKFFWNILPDKMMALDTITPFVPGSPSSRETFIKDCNSHDDGDCHLWAVWHGLMPLTFYRKKFSRFCSEFGLESLPDMKTIEEFAQPKDYSLDSEVFMAHQKCMSGNNKMLYYMSTRFRIPKDFKHLVYLTQLIQQECVKDATEHWRRNKGRCNGSLYWQINDCWPVSSWASLDYHGRHKALQYSAKHFNAPIMVSLCDEGGCIDVFAINDTMKNSICNVEYQLMTFFGEIIDSGNIENIGLFGGVSNKIKSLDYKVLAKKYKNNLVFKAVLKIDNIEMSRKVCLFDAEKDLDLPKPNINYNVSVENDKICIALKSNVYARFVRVEFIDSAKTFSDNCFDLFPNEEKVISTKFEGQNMENILKNIEIFSVTDIEPKMSKMKENLLKTKIALTPINVANWVFYHFV